MSRSQGGPVSLRLLLGLGSERRNDCSCKFVRPGVGAEVLPVVDEAEAERDARDGREVGGDEPVEAAQGA